MSVLVVGGYRSYSTCEAERFARPRGFQHHDIDTRKPLDVLVRELAACMAFHRPSLIIAQSTGALIASQVAYPAAARLYVSPFRYFKYHNLTVATAGALWRIGVRPENVAFARSVGVCTLKEPCVPAHVIRPQCDDVIAGERSAGWHRCGHSRTHMVDAVHNIFIHAPQLIDGVLERDFFD